MFELRTVTEKVLTFLATDMSVSTHKFLQIFRNETRKRERTGRRSSWLLGDLSLLVFGVCHLLILHRSVRTF